MKRSIALGSAAFIALTAFPPLARPAVADTFEFANLNAWSPGGVFFGQFVGTVEPDGLIALSDLSSFVVDTVAPRTSLGLADLRFFSYDARGGANALGFIAMAGPDAVCSGAPSVLDPRCNPGGSNPATTGAAIVSIGRVATTPDQTLVRRVTRVSAPETSTWAMMLAGFAGLGLLGARRARKGRVRSPA